MLALPPLADSPHCGQAYGAVVKKNIANAHVLIYDEQNYDTTTEAILNEYSGKRSKTLAHYKWIQDSITSGNLAVLPEMKKKDKSKAAEGSRPAEVRKVNGRLGATPGCA